MAEKAKKNVRSKADLLKKGEPGKVYFITKQAFKIANKNKFAGTKLSAKKYPGGILFTKGKEGGAFWQLKTDEKEFLKLKSAAKAAMPSIDKLDYTQSVKDLVNAWVAIPKMGGGGGGGIKAGSLAGISL